MRLYGEAVFLPEGTAADVGRLPPALPSPRAVLAVGAGQICAENRHPALASAVNAWQNTGIPGLLAAGDGVSDLLRISVAAGHAAAHQIAIRDSPPHNIRDGEEFFV